MNTKDCRRAAAEVTDRLRNSVGKIESSGCVGNASSVFVCVAKLGHKSRPVGLSAGWRWQVIVFVCCVTPRGCNGFSSSANCTPSKKVNNSQELDRGRVGAEDKKI